MKQNKKIFFILIGVLILVIGVFGVLYLKKQNDGNAISQEQLFENIITNNTSEGEVNRTSVVADLKKENPDVIGWLEIPNTEINYPVLQGTDNEYYMTHDYKKEYTKDGSLFLDVEYDWSIPSSNLLIYGHNNNNGKMFNGLMDYKKEEFYKEHPTIKFTTEQEDSEYEIIAVFLSRVYYKNEENVFRYYYFINAETEAEFNDYVENSLKASLYDTGKTAEYGEQLLTLSTCSYHTQDGRLAVVAKKISNN